MFIGVGFMDEDHFIAGTYMTRDRVGREKLNLDKACSFANLIHVPENRSTEGRRRQTHGVYSAEEF